MRFFWAPGGENGGSKKKILRKVDFDETLDVLDFCDEKTRASLLAARIKLKEEEDKKLGLTKLKKKNNKRPREEKSDEKDKVKVKSEGGDDMEIDQDEKEAEVEVPAELPTDSSGKYVLIMNY